MDKQGVRAVNRALNILKCFNFEKKELSLKELAEYTGLPKTTILRLLASLEEEGFVQKNEVSQTYKLGMILFQLGNVVSSTIELRKISIPIMEDLARKTSETVNINILQNLKRICIEKVDGSHDLRQFVEIGKELPLDKGASGKILLTYLPKEQQLKILNNQGKQYEDLPSEFNEIKEQGYAISMDERVLGASAISVPVKNYKGDIIASLTVSGATARFTGDNQKTYITLAKKAADDISKALGYKGSE